MLKRTATVLLALMTSATTWAVDNKADGKDAELISKMIMEEREEK